ncbi:NAD(P)-dependent oxidoreductase [Arthrobacter sp. 35W]|uniref:NAD(P)-dependent oxidoreductase n=1 Tax=Arthrobacter sp. 35W TaxID=1132441 RepID=UPI000425A5EE|nr:NAD(P)H-binding protein [Arthrobacter sp. 35W]
MKIAVFGATGMVGSQITAEALRRGHQVTAASRRGAIVEGAEAATPVAAEVGDAAAVAALAATHDAVVLATGPSRTGGSHQEWLDAINTALGAVGSTRVFVIGGAGALTIDGTRLVDLPDFPEAYKPEALTMAALYEAVKATPDSVDWTMQAPAPAIFPGERTGSYKLGTDSPVGESITTADFAVAALDELETPAHRRSRYTVAN